MDDLLNLELVNDNRTKFDEACEEILMALEKEPEEDLLEGLYHRRLVKSTLLKDALMLFHNDQVHYTELKAIVTEVL